MIDEGCRFGTLKNALSLIDTDISQIEAIFVTHEHVDHFQGLQVLVKHTNIPIFASAGTIAALQEGKYALSEKAKLFNIFAFKKLKTLIIFPC